jgi:hypothetical protein
MRFAVALVVATAVLGACGGDPEPEPRIGPYPASRFHVEHDRFHAADRPQTVPGAEARFLRPDDEVFGLVVGGRARAYPVPFIAYHHVVNDVIEGIPVAVTY